jgi:hypothetical protein
MVENLPVIKDPAGAVEACTYRCPTGAIQWVDGGQFKNSPVDAEYGDSNE